MAQITSVTSESLQAKIRELLPSQQGFGEDLQATNVITPVIDLTAAAEGAGLGTSLQQAIAFGSQTAFLARNNSQVLANSPGFWRIFGFAYGWFASPTGFSTNSFTMTDGLSVKTVWAQNVYGNASNYAFSGTEFDFVVFLAAGESITAVSNSTSLLMQGSYRQVATVNGTLVNPSGFVSQ